MAFLDKLMFWKKSDDFSDFDNQFNPGSFQNNNLGMPNMNPGLPANTPPQGNEYNFDNNIQNPFSQQQSAPPGFQTTPMMPQAPQQPHQDISKDIELLSYKLDTIKAALEVINQRIANLERIASGERKRGW